MATAQKTLEKLTEQEQEIFDRLAAGIDLTLARHPIAPGKTGIFNFHLPSTITETHPILKTAESSSASERSEDLTVNGGQNQ